MKGNLGCFDRKKIVFTEETKIYTPWRIKDGVIYHAQNVVDDIGS
jgi:hypothetical protein